MDGEVRGEEYSPAPKKEGHHVRNCKPAKEQTVSFHTVLCSLLRRWSTGFLLHLILS